LSALGVFLDLGFGPFKIRRRESETFRLLGGKVVDAHFLSSYGFALGVAKTDASAPIGLR
jgi:hypothetical protein